MGSNSGTLKSDLLNRAVPFKFCERNPWVSGVLIGLGAGLMGPTLPGITPPAADVKADFPVYQQCWWIVVSQVK